MSDPVRTARAVNHVGITVPDVFGTIDWYRTVFGFRCIMGPRLLESSGHTETGSVFGPRFRTAWQAHLLTGNAVGIEVFQFVDPSTEAPPDPAEPPPYTRPGPWHLCLTEEDVEAAVARVVDHGGRQVTAPVEFVPGRPWQLAYVTDPWGIVLELMSHTYAEAFGNWPQPGQVTPPTLVERPGGAA